jgi:hypothetical protein
VADIEVERVDCITHDAYYAKGHHDRLAFLRAVREELADDLRRIRGFKLAHAYARKRPALPGESDDFDYFVEPAKRGRGAFPVTVVDVVDWALGPDWR